MEEKVCLTTYVAGAKYQAYIPFLVYSCHTSYPEYDILLFVHGKLEDHVRKNLEFLSVPNCRIVENHFNDCPRMNALKAQSLRWVLWDEQFRQYDYLYMVDIDMFYIREPQPLHLQHIAHMKTTGLFFDNMRRRLDYRLCDIKLFLRRLKHARFYGLANYILSKHKFVYRATGLHFIKVKEYYTILSPHIINEYKQQIYSGLWLKRVLLPNDEALLYFILQEQGLSPEKMAVQTNSHISLEFENPTRAEFRPHHGIHLGIFRSDTPISDRPSDEIILHSSAYIYYSRVFKENILRDPVFKHLLEQSPVYISNEFERMFNYYEN